MLIALAVVAAGGACAVLPWALSALGLARWMRGARARLRIEDADPVEVDLHIVVPARDEAQNIGECVRGLVSVAGEGVTLVIVDDASEDDTAVLARDALGEDPRGSVITAEPKPPGWAGKSWACASGVAVRPDAEWFLFVDADVFVDARLPSALLRLAEDRDLVSAFGRWICPTPGVAWLMPALGWLIRGSVDPHAVREQRQAFANGQMILIRGELYRRLGGHHAVRSEVLDDVGLARLTRSAGGRAAMVWLPEGFAVRAYDSVRALFAGYGKNLVAGLGSPILAVGIGGLVLWAYTGPVLGFAAATGLVISGWPALGALLTSVSAAALALMMGLRLFLDREEGRSGLWAPLQPLVGVPLAALFVWSALGRTRTWKGRRFTAGKAE